MNACFCAPDTLEEDEFFDLEDFSSRGEFLAKVHTYQLYFNLARPNSHKQNQSPWQIIERLAPRSPLELCLLPPVFLDYYLNDSGIRCAGASLAGGLHHFGHGYVLKSPSTEQAGSLLHNPFMFCGGLFDGIAHIFSCTLHL